ncbi:MAG: hypothetical protein JNJ77_15065 [Planctomycetia bacterium]|nr:hypothetical protein [Planctomycetia bacterium]
MAELRWKTGKPAVEAKVMIQNQLEKTGYGDQVSWSENYFTASVGMGFMLDIAGEVKDEEVVLEKCGGVSGGMALGKLKKMFEYLFPGGEVA